MATDWTEVGLRIYPSLIVWHGQLPGPINTRVFGSTSFDQEDRIGRNLSRFLRDNVTSGGEIKLSINPELRHVLVHVDRELLLACGFDDLSAGPGFSPN